VGSDYQHQVFSATDLNRNRVFFRIRFTEPAGSSIKETMREVSNNEAGPWYRVNDEEVGPLSPSSVRGSTLEERKEFWPNTIVQNRYDKGSDQMRRPNCFPPGCEMVRNGAAELFTVTDVSWSNEHGKVLVSVDDPNNAYDSWVFPQQYSDRHFRGQMDELRLFSAAKTAEQVSYYFDQMSQPTASGKGGSMGWPQPSTPTTSLLPTATQSNLVTSFNFDTQRNPQGQPPVAPFREWNINTDGWGLLQDSKPPRNFNLSRARALSP
jgi:hypothetical protein